MEFKLHAPNKEEIALNKNTAFELMLFGFPIVGVYGKLSSDEYLGWFIQLTVLGFSFSLVGKASQV